MLLLFLLPFSYSGGGGEGGSGQTCDVINICNIVWSGSAASCPPGMTSVAAPERSTVYTLTSPNPSYNPDELIELHLRVTARLIQAKRSAGVRQCNCLADTTDCPLGYLPCSSTLTVAHMESAKYIGLLVYAVRQGDANEAKVGAWELPAEEPPRFHTPPDAGCGGKALMHASANAKNYFHRFYFRAPSAGTGNLVFRALVKQGDTNGGAFYWPGGGAAPSPGGSGGDLLVAKAAPPPPPRLWFRAATTEPCSAACSAHGLRCDASAIDGAAASAALPTGITRHFLCQRPVLVSCDAALPSGTDRPDAFCWHGRPAAGCSGTGTPTQSDPCLTLPSQSDHQRFCACATPTRRKLLPGSVHRNRTIKTVAATATSTSASKPALPPHALHYKGDAATPVPPCPHARRYLASQASQASDEGRLPMDTRAAQPQPIHSDMPMHSGMASADPMGEASCTRLSGGASVAFGVLSTSLLMGVSAIGGGRHRGRAGGLWLMAMALVSTLGSGHNWINSPRSRASRASTIMPCRQRTDPDTPHVQVNPAQPFLVEWTNGHPRSTHYFVLLPAAREAELSTLSEAVLEQYLRDAPTSAVRYEGPAWQKRHWGWTDRQARGGANDHSEFISEGKIEVTDPSDPYYLQRPSAFFCSDMGRARDVDGACAQADDMRLYKYAPGGYAEDVRVSYTHDDHPWIISVHRFRQVDMWAQQFDTAPFELPAGTPPGQYIVHYFWRGYRDCIDVDVLPPSLPVPCLSNATYGHEDASLTSYQRIDHCQYEAGSYEVFAGSREDCYPTRQGTCFIVPPPGQTNTNGQTPEDALAACIARCDDNTNRCRAVVVVPAALPPLVQLGSETNVPWGQGNCNAACLAGEPAGSSVCYGLRGTSTKSVEEEYTVVERDPEDEVFYSTCYRRRTGYAFHGPSCGAECRASTDDAQSTAAWRFAEQCITCDDAARNAQQTAVPHWELAQSCTMCSRPDAPPPSPLSSPLPLPPPATTTEPPTPGAPPSTGPPSTGPPSTGPPSFGIDGCSATGPLCCVVIYRGAAGGQCARVPVWDLSAWSHPGGPFVRGDTLCGTVRYSHLARSTSHEGVNPEIGTRLTGGGVKVGEYLHPDCASSSPPPSSLVALTPMVPPGASVAPSHPPAQGSPPSMPTTHSADGVGDGGFLGLFGPNESMAILGVDIPLRVVVGAGAGIGLSALLFGACLVACRLCKRTPRKTNTQRPSTSTFPRRSSSYAKVVHKNGVNSTEPTIHSQLDDVNHRNSNVMLDCATAACGSAPPPPSTAMLPHGWQEVFDDDGQLYFYNETTGQSQWEWPSGDGEANVSKPALNSCYAASEQLATTGATVNEIECSATYLQRYRDMTRGKLAATRLT